MELPEWLLILVAAVFITMMVQCEPVQITGLEWVG
jgi:hypothetical protein